MQAIIDEQGRLEIPQELRVRRHLAAGALVNVALTETGIEISTVSAGSPTETGQGKLVWDDGLLVFRRPGTLTIEDVNQALEQGRQERFKRIIGVEADD